jgi:hypothetical protein
MRVPSAVWQGVPARGLGLRRLGFRQLGGGGGGVEQAVARIENDAGVVGDIQHVGADRDQRR